MYVDIFFVGGKSHLAIPSRTDVGVGVVELLVTFQ